MPIPAVLDTNWVRTGLHYQLAQGRPPLSVSTAGEGKLRLYMERATLAETLQKLPQFSEELRVDLAELVGTLNEDWLPYINVVKLPTQLRLIDERAAQVAALDGDDYPAAALACLLSPAILLTRDTTHFAPLGIREVKHTGPAGIVGSRGSRGARWGRVADDAGSPKRARNRRSWG